VQVATVDGILRPGISRGASARLGPDQLAVPVVVSKFRGFNRRCRQCVSQTELAQLANRIRLQIDAKAERLDVGGRFIDSRIDAAA
jgi:hypothetical protein